MVDAPEKDKPSMPPMGGGMGGMNMGSQMQNWGQNYDAMNEFQFGMQSGF